MSGRLEVALSSFAANGHSRIGSSGLCMSMSPNTHSFGRTTGLRLERRNGFGLAVFFVECAN